MQEHNMAFSDAMSFVRKRRPIIFPNVGFQRQLMDFDRTLRRGERSPVAKSTISIKGHTPSKPTTTKLL